MKWYDPFPLDMRTGATFVHDWFALGVWLAVIGHILFALRDPDALRFDVHAAPSAQRWARTRRPRWFEERDGNARRAPQDPQLASTRGHADPPPLVGCRQRRPPSGSAAVTPPGAEPPSAADGAAARPTVGSAPARRRCGPTRWPGSPTPPTATSARATARTACAPSCTASARASRSSTRSPTATRCCSATAGRRPSGTRPTFGLVERRSEHLVFGEFSSKFAAVVGAAPHPRPRRS